MPGSHRKLKYHARPKEPALISRWPPDISQREITKDLFCISYRICIMLLKITCGNKSFIYLFLFTLPTACWSSPVRVTEKQYQGSKRRANYIILCDVLLQAVLRIRIQWSQAKMTRENRKKVNKTPFFEVLHFLFWGMKASPVSCTSFKKD